MNNPGTRVSGWPAGGARGGGGRQPRSPKDHLSLPSPHILDRKVPWEADEPNTEGHRRPPPRWSAYLVLVKTWFPSGLTVAGLACTCRQEHADLSPEERPSGTRFNFITG